MSQSNGLFRRPESLVHFALGGATALYSTNLALVYGGVQYVRASNDGSGNGGCSSYILQGAEYALGYFGVQLLLTNFA